MKGRICIVDDDSAVRDSLAMLLEAAGYSVEAFSDSISFLDAGTGTDCVILDVNMPGMDGPALQEEMLKRAMRLPILFLSGQGTIPITVRTIKAGAIDFLTKPVDGAVLIGRVEEAMLAGAAMQAKADEERTVAEKLAGLTRREREIMTMAVEGLTSKEIAQRLAISYRTVEIHRAHIMGKTGAANLMELAHMVLSGAGRNGKE